MGLLASGNGRGRDDSIGGNTWEYKKERMALAINITDNFGLDGIVAGTAFKLF